MGDNSNLVQRQLVAFEKGLLTTLSCRQSHPTSNKLTHVLEQTKKILFQIIFIVNVNIIIKETYNNKGNHAFFIQTTTHADFCTRPHIVFAGCNMQ